MDDFIEKFNSYSAATDSVTKEFEIRLQKVSYQDFSRFFTYLEAKSVPAKCSLDISVQGGDGRSRATIDGEAAIRIFCQTMDVAAAGGKVISKQLIDHVDISDFDFRVAFNTETVVADRDATSFYKLIKETASTNITYRFKQRVSIIPSPNLPFRFDLTIVKQSSRKKKGGESVLAVFSNPPTYEVECEFLPEGGHPLTPEMYDSVLTLMAQIRQECEFPIRADEQSEVQKELAFLGGHQRFLGAKVATLGQNELRKVSELEYGVTDKADGERRLLFIGRGGWLFFCDMEMKITKLFAKVDEDLNGTVIDGELLIDMTDNHKQYQFYAFDILFLRGANLGIDNLRDRYIKLATVISSIKGVTFDESQFTPGQLNCANVATITVFDNVSVVLSAKTYHVGGGGKFDANQIWCNKDNFEYELDGLIFTPYNEPYPYTERTWLTQYKWKPPTLNSIDFEIQFGRKGNHYLFVGEPDGKSVFAQIKLAENAAGNDGIVVQNNTIVECIFERGAWAVLKTRTDKTVELQNKPVGDKTTTANFRNTAEAIWKTILNPVDEKTFCGEYYKSSSFVTDKEKSKTFREFQNMVKKTLLEVSANATIKYKKIKSAAGVLSLIDFSCGQGGDFHKWQDLQFSSVTGIDLNQKNLVQFIERIQNAPRGGPEAQAKAMTYFQEHVALYVGDTGKLLDGQVMTKVEMADGGAGGGGVILKKSDKVQLPQHDIGASFFSVHYYFNNETDVGNFFENAKQFIKPKGHLLITCLDGEKVFDALNSSPEGKLEGKVTDTTIWKIEKRYDSSASVENFGLQIGFYMHTIFEEGTLKPEYLVPYKLLLETAEAHGFTLKDSQFFNRLDFKDNILDTDKSFAALKTFKNWHRYYIFTRNREAPKRPYSQVNTNGNGSGSVKKAKKT